MALRRLSNQASDLYQFYRRLAGLGPLNVYAKVGQQMIELLPRLESLCTEIDVWALPTDEALVLLREDNPRACRLISVEALPLGGFRISYRMPAAEAPWRDAMVEGTADDSMRACALLKIAMQRSGGWNGGGPS